MTTPQAGYDLIETDSPPAPARSSSTHGSAWSDRLARSATILLAVLHASAIWIAMGGREAFDGEWPILLADHGIHYHQGLVSRHLLGTTGTTAGYDPSFMSGYPMSIISDLSSTLSDLVMLASGDRPVLGYHLHVLMCSALVPWLIGLASVAWNARPTACFVSVLLYLIYFWTDFPSSYAALGMLNYLLSVPLGLVAVAGISAYCDRGGLGRWLWASVASSSVFLVHLTSPFLVGPAGLLAYVVAVARSRRSGGSFPVSRHLGLWAMAPLILASNAFWLMPGYFLAATKGASDNAFSHSSKGVAGVFERLGQIVWSQPIIQVVLLGLAPIGLLILARRGPVAAAGLGGFLAAGFGWGYLAGAFPTLDPFQPGRHTYACFSAACVASGIGLAEVFARLRAARSPRIDRWFALGLVLVGIHLFGPNLSSILRKRLLVPFPFLSSRPTPRISWVVEKVRKHVEPGERLLFEETGLDVPGLGDPFDSRHVSPILPTVAGVEVIGGPYLHSTVTTNFTQFGENKLFERKNWDRDFFVRHARLYRPSAICCWSPKARRFCMANPDLIRIVEDDGILLLGRVIGFEGATIRGSARVEAGPNRLVVRDAVAEEGGDGLVVLRYHAVPYLQADPPVAIEPVHLEDDPVPFIGLRSTPGPVTIKMVLPPRSSSKR
jgi:hypothetical protein